MRRVAVALAALVVITVLVGAADEPDPYLWLEEVEGQKAVAWVKEQSQRTTAELEAVPEFKPILDRTLQILDSQERIPYPGLRGDMIYNFWQDKDHPRGILRRTTLTSYRTRAPQWETVIDLDAIVKAEGVNWVYKGSKCLPPEDRLCMVSLGRGGSDATVEREFDMSAKAFVEGGFTLPEAKSSVSWRDENTLWVGTDFGPGSLTDSGYPRVVKLWKRGTPLSAARTVFEGKQTDVVAYGYTVHAPEGRYDVVGRTPVFYRHETFVLRGDNLIKLDVQEDSNLEGFFKGRMLVTLRSDWSVGGRTYPQGGLIAIDLERFLQGKRDFDLLFEPSERVSLQGTSTSRDHVILDLLDNVRGRIQTLTPDGNSWKRADLPLPGVGTSGVGSSDVWHGTFFYSYSDFLTPSSLFVVEGGKAEKIKAAPAFFSSEGMKVAQYEATSKDGTKIPYFVVMPKGFKADGNAPTFQYGYGGFENSELPRYKGTLGAAWLERGGVYVLANLRGGGEFGPRWHQAALKENRIKSFEDFIAVSEDVIARKISSPRHLGIMGGSQGGLLVTGTMMLRPDLYRAVVSQVPLTDMHRYHKLLAGASWMAEYGDPDKPEDWAYIQTWSPYHLVKKGVSYPEAYFWTNTRDDRVHPGHARKMVARLIEYGYPVYYYENIEGGHGSGSVNRQRAYSDSLEYAYLWKMLP